MQINRTEQKKQRLSSFLSSARLVSGFALAPTLGALIFYLILNVPLLFGYQLPGMMLSVSPDFLIGGTLIAGSIFYAPTVIIGLAIMMLIRRYYSWSLTNCIIGGVLSAFAVSSIFLTALMFIGQGLMVAGAGFSMIMTLIIVPAVLSGMLFWLITVYKNSSLKEVSITMKGHVQLAPAGAYVEDAGLLNIPVEFEQYDSYQDRNNEELL